MAINTSKNRHKFLTIFRCCATFNPAVAERNRQRNAKRHKIMKRTLAIGLLVCATTFCLCGCVSDRGQQTARSSQPSQSTQTTPANPPKVKFPGEERLKVGMTTDEVVRSIGIPLGKGIESDGSQFWTYNHWNTDPGVAVNYSPVNPQVVVLTVIFNKQGKVLNWYTMSRNAY